MHMSDALISPEVGGVLWIASAALVAVSVKKVKEEYTEKAAPLMGVLGAFVFAAQMINFSIPGTGSSGHLGGGILLAALLGPWAALLTITSILAIQALFFADGGLLALGCNVFNLGVLPCLAAWPLIYKPLAGAVSPVSRNRLFWACFLAAIAGLQLGAFGVVLETRLSGISELPFRQFVLLMQPIHLAIGAVEGLATAAVILFVRAMQPSLLEPAARMPLPAATSPGKRGAARPLLFSLALLAVLTGGMLSWFASSHPDGLEWAASRVSQREELAAPERPVYQSLARVQEKTAFLPDYGFRAPETAEEAPAAEAEAEVWSQVNEGTSLSGLIGGGIVFILLLLLGLPWKRKTPLPSC